MNEIKIDKSRNTPKALEWGSAYEPQSGGVINIATGYVRTRHGVAGFWTSRSCTTGCTFSSINFYNYKTDEFLSLGVREFWATRRSAIRAVRRIINQIMEPSE